MDIKLQRRIDANKFITNARWLYICGLFLIGIMARIISEEQYDFPLSLMISLVMSASIINYLIYLLVRRAEKRQSGRLINFLSSFQLIFELSAFTLIFHLAGSMESMVFFFFVLPVISSSMLYGYRGSIIIAALCAILMTSVVTLEQIGTLKHYNRYGIRTIFYTSPAIALTNLMDVSFFFIILGIYSGHVSRLIFRREIQLEEKTKTLETEKEYREKELSQLDKTTKLLVKRDTELTSLNQELDSKIKELQISERSLLKAFTDLKKERQVSEKERNKTAAIVANFIDPIIVIDNKDKISLFNPAANEIFNIRSEDIGKIVLKDNYYSLMNFKKIIRKEYQVKTATELKSQDGKEEEVVVPYRGQELTYKVITADVVDNKDERLGTMKIFYNLTREKMMDKMKSEFISIAAHQLRTPLSAIKWVMKMILDGDAGELNTEQQSLLSKGYISNERIIYLVNDMLNVSRIEEGRFGYSFTKENFNEALDIVADSLENKIKDKNLKLVIDRPKELPLAYMDKQKMVLVLQNLMENAVKYTQKNGKIEVMVKVDGKFLNVTVKDNGLGIPDKDKDKLFRKFFRAENVMRSETEGTGLGLFIVKNIIEKHNGKIWFESKEGKGTSFIFTLPLEK